MASALPAALPVALPAAGTIGGTYATPLVNPPEVAIVALGRIQHLPRFARQPAPGTHAATAEVISRAVMAVSWGADHRVLDGAALAGLSNAWKGLLEEPGRMLLHLK